MNGISLSRRSIVLTKSMCVAMIDLGGREIHRSTGKLMAVLTCLIED